MESAYNITSFSTLNHIANIRKQQGFSICGFRLLLISSLVCNILFFYETRTISFLTHEKYFLPSSLSELCLPRPKKCKQETLILVRLSIFPPFYSLFIYVTSCETLILLVLSLSGNSRCTLRGTARLPSLVLPQSTFRCTNRYCRRIADVPSH